MSIEYVGELLATRPSPYDLPQSELEKQKAAALAARQAEQISVVAVHPSARELLDPEKPDWSQHAECYGVDPDVFFPQRGQSLKPALSNCGPCTVRDKCLEYALERGEKHGVWGGASERERRRMRRARALARRGITEVTTLESAVAGCNKQRGSLSLATLLPLIYRNASISCSKIPVKNPPCYLALSA